MEEVVLSGGREEDAWIFGHSLDRAHTALYQKKFGMREYSKVVGKREETVLAVRLTDVLDITSIDSFHPLGRKLSEMTQGRFGTLDMLKIWAQTQPYFIWQFDLEVLGEVVLGANGVRDFSGVVGPALLRKDLLAIGFPVDKVDAAVNAFIDSFFSYNHRESYLAVVNLAGERVQRDYLIKLKAIQIDDFGWIKGKISDNDAIGALLGRTWYDVIDPVRSLGVSDPVEFLRHNEIHFVLSNIQSKKVERLAAHRLPAFRIPIYTMTKLNPDHGEIAQLKESVMLVYTSDQLFQFFGTRDSPKR